MLLTGPDPRWNAGAGAANTEVTSQMSRGLALDLGTATILACNQSREIVFREPSILAVNSETREIVAIGQSVSSLIGHTAGHVVATKPIRDGAIIDFSVAERMMRLVLQQSGLSRIGRSKVVVAVPGSVTPVERRAIEEATRKAGASSAHLIEQPLAGAMGAGIPVNDAVGTMVVDIGGGITEAAVISFGGIVTLRSAHSGGMALDAAIQAYLRQAHGITIGEQLAQDIKLALGSAIALDQELQAEVRGRDMMTGSPRSATVTSIEIRDAMSEPLRAVLDVVQTCLADAPAELAQDVILQGMHLIGGGALLRGLADHIAHQIGIQVHLADRPVEAVVEGAALFLDYLPALSKQSTSAWS